MSSFTTCTSFLFVLSFCHVFKEVITSSGFNQQSLRRRSGSQLPIHDGGSLLDKENLFNITINSSSPAVLDSVVKFAANLTSLGKITSNETIFTYVWENTANDQALTSHANLTSSVRVKDFSSVGIFPVQPGEYHMKVTVYKKNILKLNVKVAHGSTKFKLTKDLNGNMLIAQNLMRRKDKFIYATKRPLNFTSVLTDVFDTNYTYAYIWYANETFQEWNMNKSAMVYSGNRTGTLNITLEIKASSVNPVFDPVLTKTGVFKKYIILKDEVNITSIVHDKEIDVGSPVSVDVHYNGSSPIDMSWILLNVNGTQNTTVIHGNSQNYSIHLPDDLEEGTYYLNITMENDVSLIARQTSFSIIHQKGTALPTVSITMTILFCTIGIIVTLAALAYSALRFKQKEHVTETADFNFHPQIQSRTKITPIIKNLMNMFLERGKFSRDDSCIRQQSSKVQTYGSIESADNEVNFHNHRRNLTI